MDKFLNLIWLQRYILSRRDLTHMQRNFLILRSTDKREHVRLICEYEQLMGLSERRTRDRIIDPLIEKNIIEEVGRTKQSKNAKAKGTPHLHFTKAFLAEAEEWAEINGRPNDDGDSVEMTNESRQYDRNKEGNNNKMMRHSSAGELSLEEQADMFKPITWRHQ